MRGKRLYSGIIIFMIAASILFFGAAPASAGPQKLTIIFSGDMRGEIESCHCPKDDFGGLPRRANYISNVVEEKGDILLLDVGDVLSLRTSDADEDTIRYQGDISFKAMEAMGYDAMNAGESDLILGEAYLEEKEGSVSFPLISANIVRKENAEPFFSPYIIKTMADGLRVGILGVVNERYVINSRDLEIISNKEAVARFLPELKEQSDIIIVLAHVGLPYSLELANSVEGIDIILSGHWDVESQEPIKVGKAIVMPTTYLSRKIGRLDLEVGKKGIISYEWESTPLDETYEGNEVIEKIITETPLPAPEKKDEERMAAVEQFASERPLKVFVFFSKGCRACMEVDKDVLPGIEAKYGDNIEIEHLDIGLTENYEKMVRLENLYGVEGGYVPEVIVSRYVLMGKEEIASKLDGIIERTLSEEPDVKKNLDPAYDVAEYQPPGASIILSRFESFSMFAVMTAGLLDGVNPCAFTTIVFFISFLAFAGYRKREMAFAGISFTTAVFITYLLIGLGIFRFLRSLSGFEHISGFINITIICLAFLIGILSLIDYFRFRISGDAKSIKLKLPRHIKQRIQSVIGASFRRDSKAVRKAVLKIMWVAFSAGFIVSLLESFCTGQVYLPTIAFVLKMPGKKIPSLLYLVMYNLTFILPLVIVFILGLFGATSQHFSKFTQRHLGAVKLSTAVLFFAFAALLIIFL